MPNEIPTLDFNDTFLNMEHLRNSFADYDIEVKVDHPVKLVPPFRITFKQTLLKQKKEAGEPVDEAELKKKAILVEPYVIASRGPYRFNEPKK